MRTKTLLLDLLGFRVVVWSNVFKCFFFFYLKLKRRSSLQSLTSDEYIVKLQVYTITRREKKTNYNRYNKKTFMKIKC